MDPHTKSRFFKAASCVSIAPNDCAAELAEAFGALEPELLLFFTCSSLPALAAELTRRFPAAIVVGCSTAGEINSHGLVSDEVSALGLGAPARVASSGLLSLRDFRFEEGPGLVERLAIGIGRSPLDLTATPERFLFVMLADGLSGAEEVMLASIGLAAPGVKLIGGSAGDEFRFQETLIAAGGTCQSGAATLLLIEPGVPFNAFASHNYTPTERTIVVTSADPEGRLIHRIDGRPASAIAAELLGVTQEELESDPSLAFAGAPLVFGFHGGEGLMYNRSVMSVQGSSLLMGGAIEAGTVLSVMSQGDIVDHARRSLTDIIAKVPRPQGQLLFDCGGRLLGASATGQLKELGRVYNQIPTAGFTTYGEFFGPLLVNHTLTGVVFGELE